MRGRRLDHWEARPNVERRLAPRAPDAPEPDARGARSLACRAFGELRVPSGPPPVCGPRSPGEDGAVAGARRSSRTGNDAMAFRGCVLDRPAMTSETTTNRPGATETATLGGGCFWCTEAVFTQLRGVVSVFPGYAGGSVPNPSYEDVCTGRTGHAEVVQVDFDPAQLSYSDLLRVFFTVHDPTTRNRQGADVGTQYRSVILYHDAAQKAAAEKVVQEIGAAKLWRGPIVTELAPFTRFYPAEEYHRDYFRRNPEQSVLPDCHRPEGLEVPQGVPRPAQGLSPARSALGGPVAPHETT